ncbi:MAG: prepilin-type N-terminal cleavage/methylation domain-containing protein, partial [Planctomycetes bacterium]|nr:prepilin-type N-terminal cleavage/methylation domain-containing protein [Planctomycetota bacterium]
MKVSGRLTARRAGFTLMEALVVIAIIGIVAAILVPTISKARMRGRMIECTNNLMQIG